MIAASVVLIAATFFGYGLDVQPQIAEVESQVTTNSWFYYKHKKATE